MQSFSKNFWSNLFNDLHPGAPSPGLSSGGRDFIAGFYGSVATRLPVWCYGTVHGESPVTFLLKPFLPESWFSGKLAQMKGKSYWRYT